MIKKEIKPLTIPQLKAAIKKAGAERAKRMSIGQTELANKIGVSQAVIAQALRRGSVSAELSQKIRDAGF